MTLAVVLPARDTPAALLMARLLDCSPQLVIVAVSHPSRITSTIRSSTTPTGTVSRDLNTTRRHVNGKCPSFPSTASCPGSNYCCPVKLKRAR